MHRSLHMWIGGATALAVGLALAGNAGALTITFDDAAHGQIIDDEYLAGFGVSISASNASSGPDLAVAFDTTLMGTEDPDLEDPWSGGNLSSNTDLGRALIIQEHGQDANNDGFIDSAPDDEGSRPAGTIYIDFASEVSEFGFDLIDVEGPSEYGADSGYFAIFFNNGAEIGRVGFGDLIDSSSPYYRPGVEFGNNYANRIAPFTPGALGVAAFDEVHMNFGGSAAIDNLVFDYVTPPPPNNPIPEPTSVALLGMGITGLLLRARKSNRI